MDTSLPARLVRRTVADAADVLELVLPRVCAVCEGATEQAGDVLCDDCALRCGAGLYLDGPQVVRPHPVPRGLPVCVAGGTYAGALGAALAAYKDAGRRDLLPVLAPWLADCLGHATSLVSGADVLVVPVPSSAASRRRRGDAPLEGLAAQAVRELGGAGVRHAPVLAPRRRVADQAGLGQRERALNLEWSMHVPDRHVPRVRGRPVVVVDDVLTSGATLVEAARALRRAGASEVVAAVLAQTPRHTR